MNTFKKHLIAMGAVVALLISTPVFAMDHSGHGNMGHGQSMDKGGHDMAMDHGGMMGDMIHHSSLDGYTVMYHLIDMTAHMKEMPEMKAGHHLMMYIKDAHGNTVEGAKVGYLIIGPDGAKQQAMAMGMSGGFGGDVDLMKHGMYVIKAKTVMGDKKIMDEFHYTVK